MVEGERCVCVGGSIEDLKNKGEGKGEANFDTRTEGLCGLSLGRGRQR